MNRELLADVFENESTPLIRTDFSSEKAWQRVVAEITTPVDMEGDVVGAEHEDAAVANVETVSDTSFEGVTAPELAEQWGRDTGSGYVLLADAQSMREASSGSGLTLVYVDLSVTAEAEADMGDVYIYGRAFRCGVREIASIDINLDIANMDFADFADHADEHEGVFLGFS